MWSTLGAKFGRRSVKEEVGVSISILILIVCEVTKELQKENKIEAILNHKLQNREINQFIIKKGRWKKKRRIGDFGDFGVIIGGWDIIFC